MDKLIISTNAINGYASAIIITTLVAVFVLAFGYFIFCKLYRFNKSHHIITLNDDDSLLEYDDDDDDEW